MKLAIDFPEKDYKFIRDTYKETGLSFIPPAIKCECTEAVYNGTPYEERKTGKWEVKLMRHFAHLLICSNCGADINITAEEYLEYYKRNFRYCPLCGAKMEVEDAGSN